MNELEPPSFLKQKLLLLCCEPGKGEEGRLGETERGVELRLCTVYKIIHIKMYTL